MDPPIQWVSIPAGRFLMGAEDGEPDEEPVHWVEVKAFRMAATEVTVGQYRHCVEAGVCFPPNVGLGCTWTYEPKDKESHPINCVDWGQARTFSRWVGGDLPTEAQWEYAARGGGRDQYAGANQPDRVGWYEENSGGETHPVRQKSANGFGLYDMSGNVWEWTLDEKHVSYKGAPDQAERAWGDVPPCDTRCISGEEMRVVRGGSWRNNRLKLRVTDRSVINANIRHYNLGFRLVSLPVEGDH